MSKSIWLDENSPWPERIANGYFQKPHKFDTSCMDINVQLMQGALHRGCEDECIWRSPYHVKKELK